MPYSIDPGNPQIPDFALDSTIQALIAQQADTEDALNRIASLTNKEVSSLYNISSSSKESVNAQKVSNNTLKYQSKLQQQANATSRRIEQQNNKMTDFMKRTARAVPQALRSGDLSQVLNYMGDFGVILQKGIDVLKDYRTTIQSLTDVGQGFGKSVLQMQEALLDNRMTLAEFERITMKNGAAISFLGENAAKEFSGLSYSIRQNMKQFGNFGLSIQEINDFLAQNLEIEMKSGATRQEATANLQTAFDMMTKEATGLALETGRNRKDLIRSQLEVRSDERVAGKLRQLEIQGRQEEADMARENMNRLAKALPAIFGKEGGAQIMEGFAAALATGRGIEADPAMAKFLSAAGPAGDMIRQMSLQLTSSVVNFEDLNKVGKAVQERFGELENIENIAQVNEGFGILRRIAINFREVEDPAAELQKATENTSAAAITLLKTEEQLNDVLTGIQKPLTTAANELADGMGEISGDILESATQGISGFMRTVFPAMAKAASGDFSSAARMMMDSTGMSPMMLGASSIAGGALAYKGVKGMTTTVAQALGYNFAGTKGAAMSEALQKQLAQGGITVQGGQVLDPSGKAMTPGKSGAFEVQTSGGDKIKFRLDPKSGELIPEKSTLKKFLGGKKLPGFLGAGMAAYEATAGFSSIQESYGQRKSLLESQLVGATGTERTVIEKKLKELDNDRSKAQIDLVDQLLMTYGGSAVGALSGSLLGPGGTLAGGMAGYSLGEKGYEEGIRPIKMLLESLGLSPSATGEAIEGSREDVDKIRKRIQLEKEIEADVQKQDATSATQETNNLLRAISRKLGITDEGYLSKIGRPGTNFKEIPYFT